MTALLLLAAGVGAVRLLDAGHRQPARRSRRPASSGSACRPTRRTPGGPRASRSSRSATPELAAREALPPPGRHAPAPGLASPTRSPWVVANGWRIARHPAAKYVYDRAGRQGARSPPRKHSRTAPTPSSRSIPPISRRVGAMLTFLESLPSADLPPVADFAVVDDGSAVTGEVMNLLVAPQPAVPAGQGASLAVSASTSGSAARSIRAGGGRSQRLRAEDPPPADRRSAQPADLRKRGRDRPPDRRWRRASAAPAQLRRPRNRRPSDSPARPYRRGEVVHRRRR